MNCTHCGHENTDTLAAHCEICGRPLKSPEAPRRSTVSVKCPHCNSLLPSADVVICPACGFDTTPGSIDSVRPPGLITDLLDRRVALIGGIQSLVVSVLLIYAISRIAVPGSSLQKMFIPGGILNSIPWTIIFLFLWCVFVLIIRSIRLNGQRRQLRTRVAGEVERFVSRQDFTSALNLLEKKSKGNVLLRRLYEALYLWKVSGKQERVEAELRRQMEAGIDNAIGGYSEIRTFIWAMPVLGFIGTVIGISLAVGGFSTFLGGEIDSIEVVKTQLTSVTNGLSFAFLTTLLGLLGALFAMLPASTIQKNEEDLHLEIDHKVRAILIPNLVPYGAQPAWGQEGGTAARADIVQILKDSLPDMANLNKELTVFSKTLFEKHSECMAAGNNAAMSKLEEGFSRMEDASRKVIIEVTDNMAGSINEKLPDIAELRVELSRFGKELMDQNSAAYSQIHKEVIHKFEGSYRELLDRSIRELATGAQNINREISASIADLGAQKVAGIRVASDDGIGMVRGAISGLGTKIEDLGKSLTIEDKLTDPEGEVVS